MDFTNVEAEEIMSDDETEFGRTQKVYHLNFMLNRLNEENVNLPSSRRQLIVNKIRKLCNKGIMRDSEYHDVMHKSLENPKEQGKITAKDVVFTDALKKINALKRNLEIQEESLLPVNRDDIVAHLQRYSQMTDVEIEDVTTEMLSWAAKNNHKITHSDLIELSSDDMHQHDLRGYTFKVDTEDGAEFIIPTKVPITPFIKLEDLTPEDVYDLRPGYQHPIAANKIKHSWFDIDRQLDRRDVDLPYKSEFLKPNRTKKFRKTYGSLNLNTNPEELDN